MKLLLILGAALVAGASVIGVLLAYMIHYLGIA